VEVDSLEHVKQGNGSHLHLDNSNDLDDNESCNEDDIMSLRSTEKIEIPLSSFAKIWSALDDWCSQNTLSLLYGGKIEDVNNVDNADFDVYSDNSSDSDNEGSQKPSPATILENKSQYTQRREALIQSISQCLPRVRQDLELPLSAEQTVYEMVGTFTFKRPLPSLTTNHWRVISLVFFTVAQSQDDRERKALYARRDALMLAQGINIDEFKVFVEIFQRKE